MAGSDGTINYAYGPLEQGVNDILQATKQVNGLIDQLRSNVRHVVENWTGDSASDYHLKAQNITNQLQSMSGTMQNAGFTVGRLSSETADFDRKSATMFQ